MSEPRQNTPAVHVSYAESHPLDRLQASEFSADGWGTAEKPLYVICKAGTRGKQACEKLTSAGLTHVVNVSGGTDACLSAGLPVVRGQAVMSLERQVRIAAGSLVFLGSVLAWTVNPVWLALPAFVGAGLVFAGVTDTCGMGLLIAKMPWNQRSACAPGTKTSGNQPSCAA